MKTINHLFIFELIPRDCSIVVYGLGDVGNDYIQQIEETNYCRIVGVSDRKLKKIGNYTYYDPSCLKDVACDYIVIAIESYDIFTDASLQLLKMGVSKEKIISMHMRKLTANVLHNTAIYPQISVMQGGGLGDCIIDMLLIQKIRGLVGNTARIVYFSLYSEFLKRFDFIDECRELVKSAEFRQGISKESELVISMHDMAIVQYVNRPLIHSINETLWEYCEDLVESQKKLFSGTCSNFRFTKYGLLLNRNRLEHADMHGILGISRFDKLDIPLRQNEEKVLDLWGLRNLNYVTLNCEAGNASSSCTKTWPISNFYNLSRRIKNSFPNVKVVLIGNQTHPDLLNVVDIDLTKRTTIAETCAVLKNALFHIGGEGGLVHLMHFLNGKSIVLFGPTQPEVFGYPENTNISSDACSHPCHWLVDNWSTECPLGDRMPRCMQGITVDQVISEMERWLG